jgi:hypothetical protein
VAHVVGEVEARVVDPERPAELHGREGELLAEARHEVQARADVLEQVVVVGRRSLEDEHRAHVHVAGRGLVREKRDVDGAQAVHVLLGHA